MLLMRRFWLGTVQIGKRYGLAQYLQSKQESFDLLSRAWSMGARNFDTAQDYGEAEKRIGEWIAKTGNIPTITSKISRMDEIDDRDILDFVKSSIDQSRRDLDLGKIDNYLCHRHEDFWRPSVRDALHHALDEGLIGKFGISCYGPEEAIEAIHLDPDLSFIQLPASLVDRRVQNSDLPGVAGRSGVAVVARSLFLQGVLLVEKDDLPKHLIGLAPVLERLKEVAKSKGIPPSILAVAYVLSRLPSIDIVLGFHSTEQLMEFETYRDRFDDFGDALDLLDGAIGNLDPYLTDPRVWPKP